MKRYIWGFPGIGKSHLEIPDLRIIDADCELFKFRDVTEDDLHSSSGNRFFEPDDEYPQNYLDYVRTVDSDIVLLNCHLSLLEQLDKENVLLVYPCDALSGEYMQRYQNRGDSSSFCSYMASEWFEMMEYIKQLDYEKFQVFGRGKYLSDLFERNDFKVKVMTRKEITEQLQRAMDLGVLKADDDINTVTFNVEFAKLSHSNDPIYKLGAETLAHLVLEGDYTLDIERLLMVCMQREKDIEKEKVALERRGGLSREELEDKIMQGIVNGALGIRHGQIAPYSYGYAVSFFGGGAGDFGRRSWNCYCDLFEVPKTVVDKIEQNSDFNIKFFLHAIGEAEKTKITSFTPEKDSSLVRAKNSYTYPYRNSIADIGDVHKGNGLDGIAQGVFGGDYSSMTTNRQNDLVQTLVFLKGFCLDFLDKLPSNPVKEQIKNYLKKHGTDITTPEKLQEWIKANPEKCGREENRRVSLDQQIAASASQSTQQNNKGKDIDRGEVL